MPTQENVKTPPVSEEELRDLYWTQGLSLRQIAKKFNTIHQTILEWFIFYNIPRRKPGDPRQFNSPPPPPRKELMALYWEKGYTFRDIARHYSTTLWYVKKWFREYEIPVRKGGTHLKDFLLRPPREELDDLYWNQGLSVRNIAAKYQVSYGRVKSWFRHYKIPLRKAKRRPNEPSRPSRQILVELYCVQELTTDEIADLYVTYQSKVWRWLEFYDIPRRSAMRRPRTSPPPLSKDELEDLYYVQNITMTGLARKYQVGFNEISRWFAYYELDIKPPEVVNVPWREWEALCYKIAQILLERFWKRSPCIQTPESALRDFVLPEIVVYDDDGEIYVVIDAKWTQTSIRDKDREVHPYLSKHRMAIFWVYHGNTEVELYFKNGAKKTISYSDFSEKILTNKNIDKCLIYISSDYLIQMLQEKLTNTNEEVINTLINEIHLLSESETNDGQTKLNQFLSCESE